MLVYMSGAREWYGRDWRPLRSNLLKLCLRHSEALLMGVRTNPESLPEMVDAFIEKVLVDISQRIPLDKLGLWEKTPALFVNRKRRVEWLGNDRQAIRGEKIYKGQPINPRQALGQKLWQYFEQARREQLADDLGVSTGRIKTWERLDRISRAVSQQKPARKRCSEEHFRELAGVVKERHPNDKNLPRKVNTIEAYFYQFSDECHENVGDLNDAIEMTTLEEAKDLLRGVGMEKLDECLHNMSREDLEIVDVSFNLGIGQVQYRTIQDYLHAKSISSTEYKDRLARILRQLRCCLESSLGVQIEVTRL